MAVNRYITTQADLDAIPGSSLGDYVICSTTNGYGILFDGANVSTKIYNFSVGVNSIGYAEKQTGLFSLSPAWLNHFSNGQNSYSGTGSGNYTGPIGSRIWLQGGVVMGSTKMNNCDIHGSSSVPVIATNTGGRFIWRKTSSALISGYTFVIFGGATYLRVTGEYDPILKTGDVNYQGHRSGYAFSRNKYGIKFESQDYVDEQPMVYITFGCNNITLDWLEINGGGAFSCISFKTDHTPTLPDGSTTMTGVIHDCYMYNSSSEGLYCGNTSSNSPSTTQAEHRTLMSFYNNRVVCTGTELIQQDQGARGSIIENNICFSGDMSHMNPFQGNQLGGHQIVTRAGNVSFRKNIFHGACLDHLIQHDTSLDDTPIATEVVEDDNVCWGTRSKLQFYFNGTNNSVTPIVYRGFIGGMIDDLSRSATLQATNAIWLVQEAVTPFIINNMFIDSSIATPIAVGGGTAQRNFPKVIRNQALTEPVYVRSGFEGKSWSNLHMWFSSYGTGGPNTAGTAVAWRATDWVRHQDLWYASKGVHSSQTAPASDTTNWEQIFWDANGWNSKHVNYNGIPIYNYPPDDFRLVANDPYNKLGYGLYDNEDNDLTTYFNYEYCYNNAGTPNTSFIRPLPLPKDKDITAARIKSRIGTGNWVRGTVTVVSSTGIKSTPVTLDWVQIN